MPSVFETKIPGMEPIRLVRWYADFEAYYPECEMQTKAWFVDNAQSDWTIIDVGANIGYYSILFSRIAPRGEIHAIEPTSTVDMLAENIAFNDCRNVHIHRLAFGDRSGTFIEPVYRVWGTDPEKLPYRFSTLDDFVRSQGIQRIDAVKIDVDSFDFEVLKGGKETLRQFNPYVIVELNHALSLRCQSNMEALNWMRNEGYSRALNLDYDNFVFRRDGAPDAKGSKTMIVEFPE